MKNQIIVNFLLCLSFALNVSAQSVSITGNVKDEQGEPLIGVTVSVQGTIAGTVTDLDGNFSLQVSNKNPVLIFSYVGMKTKKVRYKGQQLLKVVLEDDTTMLDEVVAVGYASMKRRDLTGSVSSLRAKDLENVPVSDVTQALAGRIAGVQVNSASGAMDADITVRVRGGISVTQDNTPLFVIDGVPTEEGLAGLSASDIEAIDVLKDASATAIYGSRGANGIVIVTTKSGKIAKPKVTYEMFYGRKKLTKRLDVLDAADFVRLEFERGDGGYDQAVSRYGEFAEIGESFPVGSGVDWQEKVFGEDVASQMHRVSISGGSKTSNFLVSYTRNDEEGIMVNSGAKNNALRLKYAYTLNKRSKFDVFFNYMDKETKGSGSMENASSVLNTFLTYRPTAGVNISNDDLENSAFDPLETDDDPDWRNPLLTARTEERKKTDRFIQMGGSVSYKLWQNLTYRGTLSFKRRHLETDFFASAENPRAIKNGGAYGNVSHMFNDNLVVSNTLSYPWKLNRQHNFTFLLGQEYISQKNRSQSFGARKFPDENFGLDNMGLASESVAANSSKDSNNQLSFFTRVDYNWVQRYLFSLVMRADGSSKFGKNNRWGYFPSVSVAWRANEENFMKHFSHLSLLKFRLSYGAVGNCRLGNYKSLELMQRVQTTVNNDAIPGYVSTMANPDLKWETNITTNLGVDVGLFDNRMNFNIDMYHTKTRDLLFDMQIPYTYGEGSCMMNIGSTKSYGLEFSMNTVNIQKKNFQWTTSFNIAFSRTEVTKMDGTETIMVQSKWGKAQSDGDYMVKVGEPVGLMVGYVGDGIYKVSDFVYDMAGAELNKRWVLKEGVAYDPDVKTLPGDVKFKDIDGNGIINSADRTVIGKAQPLFYGGFNNTFTYKGFDLSIFANFTYGNDIYNATRMSASNMTLKNRNVLKSANDRRFVTIDENGRSLMDNPEKLAVLNRNAYNPSYNGRGSADFYDRFVEDGSFLRLNNVTLGYTFPVKWMNKIAVSNFRIYASAYNICTITGYSGFDPEVNVKPDANSNGNLTPGLDWGAHPRAFSVVMGASLTF